MAQEDSDMFQKVWQEEEAVSPVIGTILMVAITVVLAGVLVVYMNGIQGIEDTPPVGQAVAQSFSNPVDGSRTTNGGGWTVKVVAMSGRRPSMGEISVSLTRNSIPVAKMDKVRPSVATFWQSNGTGTVRWYALGAGGSMSYSHNSGAKTGISTAMTAGDFETLENAYFCVVDVNGNGQLDPGDLVEVYASNNADTTADVGGAGWNLEFTIGGTPICATALV